MNSACQTRPRPFDGSTRTLHDLLDLHLERGDLASVRILQEALQAVDAQGSVTNGGHVVVLQFRSRRPEHEGETERKRKKREQKQRLVERRQNENERELMVFYDCLEEDDTVRVLDDGGRV